MSNFNTPTRLGQANNAGDARALFKETFLTEVMQAFFKVNVMKARHYVQTLQGAKSAKFPQTATIRARYMNPGVELQPVPQKRAEVTIEADELLIADQFVSDIDMLMTHYDFRAPIITAMSEALSGLYDSNVLRLFAQGARTATNAVGEAGGTSVVSATARDDGDALVRALYSVRVGMDEKNIPEGDTAAFLKPLQYGLIVQSNLAINRDYQQNPDGNGGIDSGKVLRINGLEIVKTNSVPVNDLSADAAIIAAGFDPAEILAKYRGDYSDVAALVGNKWGVGSVMLQDLDFEESREHRTKGNLLSTTLVVGSNVLRPECCGQVVIA